MPTRDWSVSSPADSDLISQGATRMREFRVDVQERYGFPVSAYASINAAVSSIGSTTGTLLIDDNVTTTASLTIPSTLILQFVPGYQITAASGHTLTINSRNIIGPDRQLFVRTGTITFAAGTELRSTWFANIATCYSSMTAGSTMVIPSHEDDTNTALTYDNIVVMDLRPSYLATKGDRRVVIAGTNGEIDRNYLPAATVSLKGAVVLNNLVTSTSTTEAGTANAVKTAYDRGSLGISTAQTLAADNTAHTHTSAQIGTAVAGIGVGNIGSYVVAYNTTSSAIARGSTVAGSSLRIVTDLYSSTGPFDRRVGSSFPTSGTTTLSGTWRALAYAPTRVGDSEAGYYWPPGFFVRIS